MVTEDYVSFETAKLLKENGFNKDAYSMYMYDKNGEAKDVLLLKEGEEPVLRPTLQMAMKWLREEHHIHVVPKFDFYAGDYTGRIYDGRRKSAAEKDDYIAIVGNNTYEQACDAAIKYCLENLI